MRVLVAVFSLVCCLSFAQTAPEQTEEERLLATAEQIAADLPMSVDAATAAIWKLCQVASQTRDSKIHWRARAVAEKVSNAEPLNPRARFVYGYFRAREAIETFEPLTQKRREHDGRRLVQDALMMGARDPHFLLDAGLLTLSLSPKLSLVQRGVDSLVLSRRLLGDSFEEMDAARKADWHAGMAKGFHLLNLQELARDHYVAALALAPETPSGEAAREWLKARNLG